MMDANVKRIAIFRALQLGDLICAVPAFRAIRAKWPAAHVTLIGLPWARGFVTRFSAYLDAFLEFPGFPGMPERNFDLDAFPRFLAQAREADFQLAIQLHGSGRISNLSLAFLGAGINAGYRESEQSRTAPAYPQGHFLEYRNEGHEIHRLLRLCSFLGCPVESDVLEFPLKEEDEQRLNEALASESVSLKSHDYVCLNPGARDPKRRWSVELTVRVAEELASRGLRVVLTGSALESELSREVVNRAQCQVIDAARWDLDLGALAVLLAGARVVVSNDTGPAHLATALNVPSVVLFGQPERLHRWAPLARERHVTLVGLPADFTPEKVAWLALRQARRPRER